MPEELHKLLSLTQGEFGATLSQFTTKMKSFVVQTPLLFDLNPKLYTADDYPTTQYYLTRSEQIIGLA